LKREREKGVIRREGGRKEGKERGREEGGRKKGSSISKMIKTNS
jgi:hypothetical protein